MAQIRIVPDVRTIANSILVGRTMSRIIIRVITQAIPPQLSIRSNSFGFMAENKAKTLRAPYGFNASLAQAAIFYIPSIEYAYTQEKTDIPLRV